ncbi:MAG: hypothetical protein IJ048_00220 [Clostridia bacterium]|nr:hypothetical protein [Clostridia bacterium]
MQNNHPEAESASGVMSAPKNWLPLCLALVNLWFHGFAFFLCMLDSASGAPVALTGELAFYFIADIALLAALLASLLRTVWRGGRVAWGPAALIALILMEFLFWLNARLSLPYARTLGEWLGLISPGPGWKEVGAAGRAERAFYWASRLLALGSIVVGAALLEMSARAQWNTSGGEKAALLVKWAVAAALIGAVFVTAGNGEKKDPWDARNSISEWLEMDCRNAELLEAYDSHGGFHGDGESFYVLKFNDDSLLNMIGNSKRWRPLPLTDTLAGLADGLGYSIEEAKAGRDMLFPPVARGWYFFMDRQAEGEARFSDAAVMSRWSYNVILAVYDEETSTLYFAKWDT